MQFRRTRRRLRRRASRDSTRSWLLVTARRRLGRPRCAVRRSRRRSDRRWPAQLVRVVLTTRSSTPRSTAGYADMASQRKLRRESRTPVPKAGVEAVGTAIAVADIRSRTLLIEGMPPNGCVSRISDPRPSRKRNSHVQEARPNTRPEANFRLVEGSRPPPRGCAEEQLQRWIGCWRTAFSRRRSPRAAPPRRRDAHHLARWTTQQIAATVPDMATNRDRWQQPGQRKRNR